MNKVYDLLAREPVLLGGALLATVQAVRPDMSPVVMAAFTAWITLGQRWLTKPMKTAREDEEVAAYVGAVENQNLTMAGRILNRPIKSDSSS